MRYLKLSKLTTFFKPAKLINRNVSKMLAIAKI